MQLDKPTLLSIYEKMLLARKLDEIIAQTRILGNPFYIGSAFEEPAVVVGMLMKVGAGLDFDVLCTHYRSLPILVGMGLEPEALMRQAAMRDTDPWSKGRQMVSHFSEPDLNVAPMSSPVGMQAGKGYALAHTQKMHAREPVLTVVHIGDAMCAEGDFWVLLQEMALRELPVLLLISNNGGGIHTPYEQGSAAPCQSAWGLACRSATSSCPEEPHLLSYVQSYSPDLPLPGVQYTASPKPGWQIVDGSDVLSLARAAETAFTYVRQHRKPYILEYRSERGRHHSSSSNPSGQILAEVRDWDPLTKFEAYLVAEGLLAAETIAPMHQTVLADLKARAEQVLKEPPATDWESGIYCEPSAP